MDSKLMCEFEEFEGLGTQNIEDIAVPDENEDDDPTFRPTQASTLASNDLYYELEKRGVKSTGFPEIDRDRLQKEFDEEFKRDLEFEKTRRKEIKRRALQQEGMMKRRMLMEQTLQEEQDEISRSHQISIMIDLIKENKTSGTLRLDLNSVSARCLAKSMWINSTVTCLDLSSNDLDDHAGTYIARILKRNNTLKKIELDNNPLGPKTCQAFGETLKINTSLVYLSLDSTNLYKSRLGKDITGLKILSDAIRSNTTLMSLNLWRTGIPQDAGAELASAVEENGHLLFCDVNHNGIDMSDIKRITDKLDINLAAYEGRERKRRDDAISDLDRKKAEDRVIEAKRKEEEVAKWLEDKRNNRAQARRQIEEDRIAAAQAEEEERKRILAQEAEVAKKTAEEAEAKKGKKGKGKK